MAASGNRLDDRIAELADRFKLPDTAASKLRALAELVSGDEHAPTTVTKPERIIDEHFADSLIALELVAVRGASAIADLGAGAGFPGLPLALALPHARVQLVESNARKCAFIAKAVASCAIENAEVVQTRAETWPEGVGAADVVTARALATLEVVAEYAAPLLRLGGIARCLARATGSGRGGGGCQSRRRARPRTRRAPSGHTICRGKAPTPPCDVEGEADPVAVSQARRYGAKAPARPDSSRRLTADNASLMAMATVYAIANQKGGVGKTTTAVNLAACVAEAGYDTLLVDIDPQCNATLGLGITKDAPKTVYDVLSGSAALADVLVPTAIEHLWVAPAGPDLAGATVELPRVAGSEGRLRDALEPIRERYAFTLLDCPPSLGPLTVNALVAADRVIVPVQAEYFALEGLAGLLDTLALVQRELNPRLTVAGMLLTMHDGRTRLAQDVEREVREHFPELVFDTVIPRNVRIGESPSFGKPVIHHDPHCAGADAYFELAKEVAARG